MATIVHAQAYVFFVVPSVHNGKQRLRKKKTEKETEFREVDGGIFRVCFNSGR